MKYTTEEVGRLMDETRMFQSRHASLEEIESLRDVLRFHEYRYSILNDPVIGDTEYDFLFKQLEKLEEDHPAYKTMDSPTMRVSSDLTSEFLSVPHLIPMLSLGNSYNQEDLNDFDKSIKKLTGIEEGEKIIYTVEPKFDGGSIALVYENDILVRAATRGNGTEGELITPNIQTLSSIPLKAKFSKLGIQTAELRGEALIRKDVFDDINKQREKEGKSLFANPRNAATGSLRTKDPNETRQRGVEAFMFQLGYAVDTDGQNKMPELASHNRSIDFLGDLGFKIPVEQKKKCIGIEEVVAFIKEWEEKRDNYAYEIDGMVVKVDDFDLQEKCGYTAHHPRWAIAYKFKAKQATSILEDVEYQVGKIGSITPVAKIKPVSLAGVTVSSISLHNEEFIRSKDIRIGDTVVVERAGDVIPYIVKSMGDIRTGIERKITFPSNCPSCNSVLVQQKGEAAWRCVNPLCEAQIIQRLSFHVSKDAMNIDGFGKSYIERFHQEGWIKDISDVYNLDYTKIAQLDGFGEKSAKKLELAINKAKLNPISRLLYSLSIHHFGKKASKIMAEQIEDVIDLQNWTVEQMTDIKDIGPVVAENVVDWFSRSENIEILERMRELGVNLKQTEKDRPVEVDEDAPLIGKSILFTGALQQMTRKEAQKIAEENGAKNISAVSSKLDILVVGEKAGSKLKKAQALGSVLIMTEEDFLAMVNPS